MAKSRVKITDKDRGFARLISELGEMGSVTLGVQGAEAETKHPDSDLTVGEIAAIHELGLGVPERSWLRKWMDANRDRIARETKEALQQVVAGKLSRKQALVKLGYGWTEQVRDQIWRGQITPPLHPETIARKKGETRPLIDTRTLVNSITYKVFLPQLKSILNKVQRAAARGRR